MTDGTTFWMEQYEHSVRDKKALGEKLKETLEENKDLQEQLDKLKDRLTYSALKNMETEISRLKESLDAADSVKKELQQKINELRSSNEVIRSINSSMSRSLSSSMHQAQDLKTQLEKMKEENESLHNVVDSFVDKCKEVEDKAEGYENALKDMKERLDKSIADRKELQADRDIWFTKNSEKLAEIEELKKDLDNAKKQLEYFTHSRDEWRDRAKHAEKELEENKQGYAEGYSDGNEEGQNELWEMLQLVRDMQPNEFDTECECLGDVIDMDLEDFKEVYSKWEEEKKNVEYMRRFLICFCNGKRCQECPLHGPDYKCGRGWGFEGRNAIPDEEIERYYNKVKETMA